MSAILLRKIVNIASIPGIVATVITAIYFIRLGVFKDINTLRGLVGQSVILDPIIFMSIQIIQVIISITPGGASCAAGVPIFGPAAGSVYSYAGIVPGSIIILLLGRNCGKPLIMSLIGDKIYNKYIGWLDNEKYFERLFAPVVLFPIAPDDTLRLMIGLTKMSMKKFTLIILLVKPTSIYLHSLALIYGGIFLTNLLGM